MLFCFFFQNSRVGVNSCVFFHDKQCQKQSISLPTLGHGPHKRRRSTAAELSQSLLASLDDLESENSKLKEEAAKKDKELAKKDEEVIQLRLVDR